MEIKNVKDIDAAIASLEQKKVIQEAILKKQYHDTIDHYKPKNLIKSAVSKVFHPGETGPNILKAAGGIGAGFLAKSLLKGGPTGAMLGTIARTAIKLGASNGMFDGSNKIGAWGKAIFKNIFVSKDSVNGVNHKNV